MDEFTAKIMADEEDRKAHPENWTLPFVCKICGKRRDVSFPKEEVALQRQRHGDDPVMTDGCSLCKKGAYGSGDDDEEEED